MEGRAAREGGAACQGGPDWAALGAERDEASQYFPEPDD